MYLLDSQNHSLASSELMSPIGSPASMNQPNSIIAELLGEERPIDMLTLLSILVLLLHVWGLLWLMRPVEQLTSAQPLMMEVSMLAVSAPKPAVAPPPPAPPPAAKKTPPKKTKPKPVRKPPPPVVQEAAEFAPAEPLIEPPPAAQTTASQSTSTTDSKVTSSANAEQFTEANFRANYAHNPKPDYPSIARSRGWQGKVTLRVAVSAEGRSEAVAVEYSSGHEMLDDSAVAAVRQWQFVPARRGETAVASSVLVPIIFTLRD
ncbi:MAG: energy transducer TonB [Methylomonas sp.]|jgi:protein TonB|uniref:energy transducer TonB n=1 Tax=Methylomonas sp. TaxID=418 RepID=UPI0025DB466B|nr:energy transducer TonB [Methylomonas sp.]MCK9609240.1 energy transducer TonB [Methylomonas sp.]